MSQLSRFGTDDSNKGSRFMCRHTHVLSSILFMVFFLLVNPKNLEFSSSGSLKLHEEAPSVLFIVFFLLINPKNLEFPSSDSLNLYEVGIERSFFGLFLLVNPKNLEFSSSDSLKLWRSTKHSF